MSSTRNDAQKLMTELEYFVTASLIKKTIGLVRGRCF